jgi:3-phosphoshikimate 1-carboxyvinyltransferase
MCPGCQNEKYTPILPKTTAIDSTSPQRLNGGGAEAILIDVPAMAQKRVSPSDFTMPQPLTSLPSGPLKGRASVPGDKSISHRALLLGALSTGTTRISGLLEADDVKATAKALAALGAQVENNSAEWIIKGRGVGGLRQPEAPLDLGNSGTGARLLMGAIAGNDITATITGDASLCARPMARVLDPLRQMGLQVVEERETLPLTLIGTSDLVPIDYVLPVPSAQVKSAVLLAGLHAPGRTSVIETHPTRDHTERMLVHFGAQASVAERQSDRVISVAGDAELRGCDVVVPGDPSSAAFLIAAALITPGSDITVENVLINPTRTGFYRCLEEMGADIVFENERSSGGEQVADIRARSSQLRGIRVPAARAPSMIDEYPCLAVVASFAGGETHMEGLAELRMKESDRLSAIAEGLLACGVSAAIEGDTLRVSGGAESSGGGPIQTQMDHRIAMAFLIFGLAASRPVAIDDASMIATSFPDFVETVNGLGARLGQVSGQ